jgi:hypothetical protein
MAAQIDANVHIESENDRPEYVEALFKVYREIDGTSTLVGRETVTVSGGKATVLWNLKNGDRVVVKVDPGTKIEETNEGNNEAEKKFETGVIKGKVMGKNPYVSSGKGPLKNVELHLYQRINGKWSPGMIYFTDTNGEYEIPLDHPLILPDKDTKIEVCLNYSPAMLPLITLYDETDENWRLINLKYPNKPLSVPRDIGKLDITKTYTANFDLTVQQGSVAYITLVNTYNYFKKPPFKYRPPIAPMRVQLNDDDTSWYIASAARMVINEDHMSADCIIAHEYSHAVSADWNIPYGPGDRTMGPSPREFTPEEGLDENWANFGSSLARNTSKHHGGQDWCVDDINDDSISYTTRWDFAMAAAWWDLLECTSNNPDID